VSSDAFQDVGRLLALGDKVAIASRSLSPGTRIDHNGRGMTTDYTMMAAYRFAIGLSLSLILLLGFPLTTLAGEVKIEHTVFEKRGNAWTVETTLRHGDTGWEHYADAWRVVDEAGKELGKRVLLHPHEDEQPFTRSLNGMTIPSETQIVYVEAHDKVHGWSQQRIRVDLRQKKGDGFEVKL
jgi:hypothetical protein